MREVTKTASARDFHERYGVVRMLDSPRHPYLPLPTLRQALGP